MTLKVLLSILLVLSLQAIAFELVVMDYEDVNYKERTGQVVSYEYKDDGCSCVCTGY